MFTFPQSACSRSSNSSMLYITAFDALCGAWSCKVWIQLLSYENMQLSNHCSSANLKPCEVWSSAAIAKGW